MLSKIRKYAVGAFLAALITLLAPVVASAVTVSGTITDPSGQNWGSSTYAFVFLPGSSGVPIGTGESTSTVTGTLSSGAFSGVVLGNNDILGGFWTCTVTAVTGQSFTAQFRITAASSSLSTVISAFSPLLGLVPQTFTTISGSVTLATAAPSTTRDVIGSATLSYGGVVTIGGGTGNVTGIRGVVTINSGTTLNAGYVYGTQGKVVVGGTLTTTSGGGDVAGLFGQLDISSGTITSTGNLAPAIFDMGSSGPAASVANLHGLIIQNTTATVAGSAIHIMNGGTGNGFTDVLTIVDATGTMAVTTGSPGTCTNAGYMNVKVGSTAVKVPFCI